MITKNTSIAFSLEIQNITHFQKLCGPCNENLKQIESRLSIHISNRENQFILSGDSISSLKLGKKIIQNLHVESQKNIALSVKSVHLMIQQETNSSVVIHKKTNAESDVLAIKTPKKIIKLRNNHQKKYIQTIRSHDLSFGIGPAGTGKTFLAVACAIEALEKQWVEQILLVRPAVEAGEKLGFLPGDLNQKIDPYLKPLFDALYEMLGAERTVKLMEKHVIEVAPLAYMRGRTLNKAFVILDESQNTTIEQMKMFLTRMGLNSTFVITGDITQVDLPKSMLSGLRHAVSVLASLDKIGRVIFTSKDVVRHPLVQDIVEAYEAYEVPAKNTKHD